jgi:hypothetical protein
MNTWKNYSSQVLNVHGNNDVRETDIHIAEALLYEPRFFQAEIAIEEVKYIKQQVLIKFWQR